MNVEECPVCFRSFEECIAAMPPCKHPVCLQCLMRLKLPKRCPMCRMSLVGWMDDDELEESILMDAFLSNASPDDDVRSPRDEDFESRVLDDEQDTERRGPSPGRARDGRAHARSPWSVLRWLACRLQSAPAHEGGGTLRTATLEHTRRARASNSARRTRRAYTRARERGR